MSRSTKRRVPIPIPIPKIRRRSVPRSVPKIYLRSVPFRVTTKKMSNPRIGCLDKEF